MYIAVISNKQCSAMEAIIAQWQHVAGDYASTMLYGIVHAFCDSGICTDALSVDDAKRAFAAGLYNSNSDDDCDAFIHNNGLDEINAAVVAYDGGAALQCVQVTNAIAAVADENTDFETLCNYLGGMFEE
jgi:hypothetical protein